MIVRKMKVIYFAGGCFWGTQHYMGLFEGVVKTEAGYANGNVKEPTYQLVYSDRTGHVECVKVTYDDDAISLATLCRLFFRSIDPLLVNRQGNDYGTRYRTGIYWEDEADRDVIDEVYEEVRRSHGEPLAVEKCLLRCFYPAEEYHQEYLIKNPDGYCHLTPQTIRTAETYSKIVKALKEYSDEEKKLVLPRFFKTGKGEYGEGDRFLGVVVPSTRKVARMFKDSSYDVLDALIESEWHECRLCALLILIEKYRDDPDNAVWFYETHIRWINNWDLVDLSAPYILGDYLLRQKEYDVLYEMAGSTDMWEQRIAVVSALTLIRHGIFTVTLRQAPMFFDTRHDLMQKSVGWMLREVGKRDQGVLMEFLDVHRKEMPRTMLRYAIERFSPEQRRYYMTK